MNISKMDLNLLVVFDAIFSEGGITPAARKLHLTQPAVSHALNRLRDALGDPLFVREGRAVVPTPRARKLARPVRNILRDVDLLLTDLNHFDPTATGHKFTLGMRDVIEPLLLPALQHSIATAAPKIDIASIQTDRRALESELANGHLDVALDMHLAVSDKVLRQRVQFDPLVVVCRREHPRLSRRANLDDYLGEGHILATVRRTGGGIEDMELSRHGLSRHIQLRCQHYFAALEVVRQNDLVLTMPRGYAEVANRSADFLILPFPLDLPPPEGFVYWHMNVDDDPANQWLRGHILGVFARRDGS